MRDAKTQELTNRQSVCILSAIRTPIGSFQGTLSSVSAPQLGAVAARAAMQSAAITSREVDELLFGCVLSAGLAQAPARQVALGAGLPVSTPCTTLNKMCGSGMKAVMVGYDQIQAGSADMIVAGGMESMSNAPYLLAKVRAGLRLGHAEMKDHMFYDGLEDAYSGRLMGSFAQEVADRYELTREQMDDYAIESLERAQRAMSADYFKDELVGVNAVERDGDVRVTTDEQPFRARIEKIRKLKPAFAQQGTVTAANSSSISDGAAALVLTTEQAAQQHGLHPMARIVGHATHAQDPGEFTLAPIGAIKKLLSKIGWTATDVDLFEINEAFAMVVLLTMRELQLEHEKVNVHGGACALGHPIGASGARILVTLLHALKRRQLRRGVAALCIGGGEATAMAVEML